MIEEKGSFRDPAGKVFYFKDRVFRMLSSSGKERFQFVSQNNILKQSIEKKYLISTKILDNKDKFNIGLKDENLILEHEKIPYISYPYEWSFSQLKKAAIFHLDFQLFLLELDATLIDASAYNIQFIGNNPIFIDVLSISKYQDGQTWNGHKQFCENFLNPLVLKSKKGVNFNNWFKGNIEGISTEEINKILSLFDKFSYNIFIHIYLLNKLEENYKSKKSLKVNKKKIFLKKNNFISILKQLRKFILKLTDYKSITTWDTYSFDNSYSEKASFEKKEIVKKFFEKNNFKIICDIGCNDGEYSEIALQNKCKKVIGFDYDLNAVENAFKRSENKKINFLPLFFDAANPSSSLGWNENERKSFKERANFDGMIALAFEHHLAIGKNIPLNQVILWLTSLAPKGLIEFVPKDDITVKKMLEFKGDIFNEYSVENFEKYLNLHSKIVSKKIIETGRIIYEFQR